MNPRSEPQQAPPGRFRGGVRNAVLWAVTFGLIGLVIALFAVSGPGTEAPSRWIPVLSLALRFALFGLICGTLFGWLTGLLFEQERFARYGRVPVALCGAIGTAVFVPLFMQTMNLLSGDGLVAWGLVLDDAVWAFFFGGIAALGSLEMARRWTWRADVLDR